MLNSFEPIVDDQCKILILGTMPSVKSLEKKEYYGNKQNKFWEIVYLLLGEKVDTDYEKKKGFLLKHHIAIWDVLRNCHREGSSDSKIKNPIPNDFKAFFHCYPNIKGVFFNGQKAEELFMKLVWDHLGLDYLFLCRLPSTSPANTIKFQEKLKAWQEILNPLEG